MSLQIKVFQTGQLGNNVCLLYEETSRKAIVFDPSYEPQVVLTFIQENILMVESILLTHGHFDHFAGAAFLLSNLGNSPRLGMHAGDLDLLRDGGGSKEFHMPVFLPRDPDFFVSHGQALMFEQHAIQVISTPGHTQGSVVYYVPELETVICGDLIFYHSVGRTDLYSSSPSALVESIRTKIFTLPSQTRLIPGHGPLTSVAEEIANNPYVDLVG